VGTISSRQVHLVRRPTGWPEPADFDLVTVEIERGHDEVVVRNTFMSVDPYMRGRMNDAPSYAAPYQLGKVMYGGAVGVVESSPPGGKLAVGDLVVHQFGWRDHAVAPASAFQRVDPIPGLSPSLFLGALGMPGLTGYVGLLDIAAFAEGDRVFVSAAAGAVGSMVGQLAKLRGAFVVGSAGSPDKVSHLLERLGFDAAFDYHDGDVATQLAHAVGESGIDVYFDNVGGDHLEAALGTLNPFGRVAACGAISRYNDTGAVPGPRNLALVIGKRLTIRGFIVSDHADRQADFLAEVAPAIAQGRIVADETVVDGLDNAVAAFLDLMRGANVGKMVVALP
jgi:NADPH-dependent curcumin reductase CurA